MEALRHHDACAAVAGLQSVVHGSAMPEAPASVATSTDWRAGLPVIAAEELTLRELRRTGAFVTGARLVLGFAFKTLKVHRMEARAAVENGRGNGALRKLGAVPEARLRGSFRRRGKSQIKCSGRYSHRSSRHGLTPNRAFIEDWADD